MANDVPKQLPFCYASSFFSVSIHTAQKTLTKCCTLIRNQERGVLAKGVSAESSVTPQENKKDLREFWAQQCIGHSEPTAKRDVQFCKTSSKNCFFLCAKPWAFLSKKCSAKKSVVCTACMRATESKPQKQQSVQKWGFRHFQKEHKKCGNVRLLCICFAQKLRKILGAFFCIPVVLFLEVAETLFWHTSMLFGLCVRICDWFCSRIEKDRGRVRDIERERENEERERERERERREMTDEEEIDR